MNRHSALSYNLSSVSRQEEMSSSTYTNIPPSFAQRTSLQGLKNPPSKNCAEGNDSSVSVSDIYNMSIIIITY